MLAADIDLSPHLMAEGEGASCPAGYTYPSLAIYTANLPANISVDCFRSGSTTGGNNAPSGEIPPEDQPTISISESETNDGFTTADVVPLGTGMGENANVDVLGTQNAFVDNDFFRAELDGGDVLHINVFGAATTVSVFDTNGKEMLTSNMDVNSNFFPSGDVRTPKGGNASLGVVIPRDGTYYIQVSSSDLTPGGAYTAELRVQRPALEANPVGTHQRLFIDFDGAVIDTALFGGVGTASLTPLSAFMTAWGLARADEDALIDAILADLEENLGTEIRAFGENGDFLGNDLPGEYDIEILNSRDHLDPFGEPNVSRVIIGGTIPQFGIPTLGIAESVDPGNLDTTESAVVLLDVMSGTGPLGSPVSPDNINTIPLATGATKIDVVAKAVAGVAAHEAGHFFGLWHTVSGVNSFGLDIPNLQDVGGNGVFDEAGTGPDGIFGSLDDIDTGFLTPDEYNRIITPLLVVPEVYEGGIEDTLNTLAWGLSTGRLPSSVTGVKFHDLNSNGIRELTEPGLPGWTIYSDLDGNGLVGLREPKTITGADGSYVLAVPPGQHTVREVLQPGWRQTFPTSGSHTVVVQANSTVPDVNFGNVSQFGGISGTKFNDLDGDGVFDQDEPGVRDIVIYLDLDGDNRLDLAEPQARTDSEGNYSITIPRPGTYTVREALVPGWEQTFPKNIEREHSVFAVPGQSFPGLNFGNTSRLDYGDAPTAAQSGFASDYPTTIANDGAVHAILPGFHMGPFDSVVDGDPDGAPNVTATGDDANTTLNDEDGVTFNPPTIFPGSAAGEMIVTITTSGYSPGRINAWMDFNRDGDWDDEGEMIVTDFRAGDGVHVLTFPVPADASSGETYVRVRYGYERDVKPTGSDIAGEVEDHRIRILSETPLAVDDQFTVTQGAGATTFDVLLNDLQSLSPPLQVIAAGATTIGVTAAGGQVTVAANGTGVVYTPPLNYFGDDSFSYTIRDGAGNTDSADVSVTVLPSLVNPLAVDDSFTVQAGSTNNQLRILANDLTGQNPPIGIVAVDNPVGGSIAIDNRGTADTGDDTLVYTPTANFTGTDQFTYTVQDQNQQTSTATVTVHVDDADDDRVRIRLQATDLNGNPIQAIGVGEEFNLQVLVADDLRPDDEDGDDSVDRFGVAGAYLDILYNFNLVSLSSRAPIFDANFLNATSIATSTPGLIDEAGAFQTDQSNPLGRVCQIEIVGATCAPEENEFLVLTIPLRATAQGLADFIGDPADRRTNGPLTPPDHDVLLFNPAEPVLLEQIRYENDSLTILGSGGLPFAVDNTFHLNANSTNNVLDVLANDTEVSNPPLTITGTGVVAGAPAIQGNISIASDGSAILYTPRTGFVGTEQFTYTVANDVGLSSDAVVTVQVGNSPNDINLRLETTDVNGNPISTITAGSEFKVRAYVQDIRTSPPDPARTGVFAIYFDLLYDSGLVITKNDPANRFGFDITFASPYNANGLSANNSFLNVVDEVGAFQTGDVGLGTSEFLLTEMTFRANTPGVAEFFADPPDLSPFHDILLFEPPAPIPLDRVNLGVASITVLGIGAEGEYTNPQNRLDVSGNGTVEPRDVLLIYNDLERNGSRRLGVSNLSALGEGEGAQITNGWVDTNADGYASPIDALNVINHLNNYGVSEGEGSLVLSTNTVASPSQQEIALAIVPVTIEPNRHALRETSQSVRGSLADATSETRAIDTLFYHHDQSPDSSSQRDGRGIDETSDLVSDDLLELLADRDSGEI